jgi:hypothetical protein
VFGAHSQRSLALNLLIRGLGNVYLCNKLHIYPPLKVAAKRIRHLRTGALICNRLRTLSGHPLDQRQCDNEWTGRKYLVVADVLSWEQFAEMTCFRRYSEMTSPPVRPSAQIDRSVIMMVLLRRTHLARLSQFSTSGSGSAW